MADSVEGQIDVVAKTECDFSALPKEYSQEIKNLVAAMLDKDKAKRPSCNDILKNKYILSMKLIITL